MAKKFDLKLAGHSKDRQMQVGCLFLLSVLVNIRSGLSALIPLLLQKKSL